jgi:hypothetical protein
MTEKNQDGLKTFSFFSIKNSIQKKTAQSTLQNSNKQCGGIHSTEQRRRNLLFSKLFIRSDSLN